MATLKEFEDELRTRGMSNALAILDELKQRDRAKRSIAPARRIAGKKMTADLARQILAYHATTGMTQQEIAFKLGVNQGRVNEVIKRGKWLGSDPGAQEHRDRDKAMQRLKERARERRAEPPKAAGRAPSLERAPISPRPIADRPKEAAPAAKRPDRPLLPTLLAKPSRIVSAQLAFLDL